MEWKKIYWMLKLDILSLWRHKSQLAALIVFPILMITLFGYGMGGTIENVPIAVVDQSHGNVTDMTLMSIKNMSLFEVKEITHDINEGKRLVDTGQVKATIILPSNYEDIDSNDAKTVVLYYDSSDQIAGQAIVPTTQNLFAQIGSQIGAEKVAKLTSVASPTTNSSQSSNPLESLSASATGVVNTINLQINRIYGDIKYMDFLVPAILAMTIMMSCMMGMGRSIAGERETGELVRLFMTPTSVATVIGGKIISKLTTETMRAMILLVTAILLFGIVINGSFILAVLLLVLGALCFVGFGIMISATAQTQEDYAQTVMPFSMPMMFVSGVFYPIETMPWIFQKIAYICPLTYLNDALRGVMLKGYGVGDIWIDIAVLFGFTALFFIIGVLRFNRDV